MHQMHWQPNNISRDIYKHYFQCQQTYWKLGWHKTIFYANKQDLDSLLVTFVTFSFNSENW